MCELRDDPKAGPCAGGGRRASSRSLLLACALAGVLAACADPRPRVVFVPHHGISALPPLELAAVALADLGYTVLPPDRVHGTLATDWVYRDGFTGRVRSRVLVRALGGQGGRGGQGGGFAVSVPVELDHGGRFALHGEDEEERHRVVGTLIARMQSTPR